MGTLAAALTLAWGAGSLQAFVKPGGPIGPGDTPDYLTTPNWAYSPPMRKFVDPLPGLTPAGGNGLVTPGGDPAGQYIPIAVPDIVTYPGSDYYVIELRQFTERMHSDLDPTTIRGYMQTNLGTDTSGGCTDPALGQGTPCTTDENTVVAQTHAHYLGPVIIAQKDRPVRVKFVNALPAGAGGDLFVPVDRTIMGAGPFEINYDPVTKQPIATKTGDFAQNRGELHLHGGRTPWISDGTPHQWITPAGEVTDYPTGVSVENVPDMPAPGPGEQTYYWTNQQSSRMLFYHDHAWGITRLNVYVGEAAGYLITDPLEKALVGGGTVDVAGVGSRTFAAGTIPADQIPLVIQDKTYVDPATVSITDPTWNWGTNTKGDFWWPHVYMPAQNPFDITGIAPMGRWAYGPYFWPATNNPFQPIANPYYNMACDPTFDPTPGDGTITQADIDLNTTNIAGYSSIFGVPYCQPPEIPSTPNPSWGAEAFMDTPIVNGTAYPVLNVDPKPYRLRVLNAAHDRFFNLQMYEADATVDANAVNPACGGNCAANTEVKMLPALDRSCPQPPELANPNCDPTWPATWPADNRPGGIPDWTTVGPSWILIGTEGGFLPRPVVIPNQPVNWNADVTTFNAGNVNTGSLILGPAERADVIVDFSAYAGKTLILYNDAPAPWPALDPHYDYYTGAPDNRAMGGADTTLPGMGPNTRTIMQIQVGTNNQSSFNLANLQEAFTSTVNQGGDPGAFQLGQDPLIVGQGNSNPTGDPAYYEAFPFDGVNYNAYNEAYDRLFPSIWPNWGIARINDKVLYFTGSDGSTTYNYNPADTTPLPWDPALTTKGGLPMQFKAIQDEQGETFDDYGRMRAALGLELITPGAGRVNFIVQTYSDPSTEILEQDGIQVWKITHNGVDTHPVHFHLFDVQVLNRVGWDGFIRLPDPTEIGWKDTVRISPLEDTIVALKPVTPRVPFGVPESYRPKNPATPLGDTTELSLVDPTTGQAWLTPNVNEFINLKWEYVWHCHILSHEENDMMRPVKFNFVSTVPAAPTSVQAVPAGADQVDVTWNDPTPVNYVTQAGFGDPAGEIGFRVERSTNGGAFVTIAKPLANSTSYSDTTAVSGSAYAYRVVAYNAAGAKASTVVSAYMSGSILINGGATEAASTAAVLTLSASTTAPGATMSQMRFSKDGGATWLAWEAYATTRNVTLTPAGAGVKSFSVQYRDSLGNLSAVYTATITVVPPSGSIVINGGAVATNTTAATLTLAATSPAGITQMRFSKNGGATWTVWEPYATTRNVSLAPAGVGTKTMSVRFRDAQGNVTPVYTDTIELELTPPTGSILINGGAPTTTSVSVTLTLSATDASGVTQMQFSKDGGATWTVWEPYATTRNVTLAPAGPGLKTIDVRYKDSAGNISPSFQASITLL
jgi:FtsP/CotA-like multicopper oxidase with cupredoxin domain